MTCDLRRLLFDYYCKKPREPCPARLPRFSFKMPEICAIPIKPLRRSSFRFDGLITPTPKAMRSNRTGRTSTGRLIKSLPVLFFIYGNVYRNFPSPCPVCFSLPQSCIFIFSRAGNGTPSEFSSPSRSALFPLCFSYIIVYLRIIGAFSFKTRCAEFLLRAYSASLFIRPFLRQLCSFPETASLRPAAQTLFRPALSFDLTKILQNSQTHPAFE